MFNIFFMFLILLVSFMHASSLEKEHPDKANNVNYKGAQVWRVKLRSASDQELFKKLEYDEDISLWRLSYKNADILVQPEHKEKVQRQIRSLNLNYSINVYDVQNNIDKEQIEMEMFHRVEINDTYWTRYNKLIDVDYIINRIAMGHPEIITESVIGVTNEKREIKLVRLSNGNPNNKAVLIEGTIHAREWISTATVIYIMKELISNFSNESDDIRRIDWYFIPVLNPDGYNYSHQYRGGDRLWRKNRKPVRNTGIPLVKYCYGVDLNRNFGYQWGGKGTSVVPCREDYGGEKAFSEGESIALRDFVTKRNVTLSAYLSFHSYGQMILYPSSYDKDLPQKDDLHALGNDMAEAIRNTSGYHYKVGSLTTLMYAAGGNTMDWILSTGVKYAYIFELNDKGHHGFILPSKYIKPVGEAVLAAVRVLAAKVKEELNNVKNKKFLRKYTLLGI